MTTTSLDGGALLVWDDSLVSLDDGTTGLLYGGRVPKDDLRTTAYGTVDECVSALGVARHYGPELLDGWVVDEVDADAVERLPGGIRGVAVQTLMDDVDVAAALARTCLGLADDLTGARS